MSSKAVYSGVGVPGSGLLPSSRSLVSRHSRSCRSQKGRHGSRDLTPDVEIDEYMDPESRNLQPDFADAVAKQDNTDKLSGENDEAWDSERGIVLLAPNRRPNLNTVSMSSKAVYSGVGVPGSGLFPSSRPLGSRRSSSCQSQKGRHSSLNLPPDVEIDEYMDPESRVLQPDVADADATQDITDKFSGDDDEAWDSERGSHEHSGRFAVCRAFCCRYRFAVAGYAILLLTIGILGTALVSEKRKNAVGAKLPRGSPKTDATIAADAAANNATDTAAAADASTLAPTLLLTPTPTLAPTKPKPLSETADASTPMPTLAPTKPEPLSETADASTPMPTLAPTKPELLSETADASTLVPTPLPTLMPTLAPTKPEPLSETVFGMDYAALEPPQQEVSMSMSMSLSSFQRRRRMRGGLNKHKRVKKVWKGGELE